VVISPQDNNDPQLRRSKRLRFKPLKYWAGEHIDPTNKTLNYEDIKEKGDSLLILGVDYLEDFPNQRVKSKYHKKNKEKNENKKKKLERRVNRHHNR